MLDGKIWQVKDLNVDPDRVGIYGGSYGDLMTETVLLRTLIVGIHVSLSWARRASG